MATTINLGKLKKEMEGWPKSWAGFNSDIPIGQRIVQTMYPFLLAMVAEGYSKTTINRYASNLICTLWCYKCIWWISNYRWII